MMSRRHYLGSTIMGLGLGIAIQTVVRVVVLIAAFWWTIPDGLPWRWFAPSQMLSGDAAFNCVQMLIAVFLWEWGKRMVKQTTSEVK